MSEIARLSKELVFLILQFCKEEKLDETAHMLERETAVFLDLNHFESLVIAGRWDEVERYLSGYGNVENNKFLRKVYFEVRKQKLFEALEMGDRAKALEIVRKELKVFASHNQELFKEITQLLILDDFREHEMLSAYGDIYAARINLGKELRMILEADPFLQGKLEFPIIGMARLRRLINQGLNWQHLGCQNPKPVPDIKSLFNDHICGPPEQAVESGLDPLQPTTRTANCSQSSARHADNQSAANRPIYPDCSENSVSLSAVTSESDEVEDYTETRHDVHHQEVDQPSPVLIPDSKLVDLPNTVGCVLNEISCPTAMSFCPVDDSILLVGTDNGDIALWNIARRKKLFSRSFNVWDVGSCTMTFKAAFMKDPHVSVNSVGWSPVGHLIGVAYSKHIVQLYNYEGGNDLLPSLEIDAHAGNVNDVAFAKPNNETVVITCGDDKIVKVWDALTGRNMYVFDDHNAAVISVCPREIKGVDFIFSTTNGAIRGWMYDNLGWRIGLNDPCYGRIVCTKDGKRIFACGVDEEERSCILEWDDDECCMNKTYQGLKKPFPGVVHFDTAKEILAAGDDHEVKFWDMSSLKLLTSTKAGGGLPVYPYIRFSKEGMFLAISANNNRVVIMATSRGLELLKAHKTRISGISSEFTGNPSTSSTTVADDNVSEDGRLLEASKHIAAGEDHAFDEALHLVKIDTHSELYVRMLSADVKAGKICRLVYGNNGDSILALTSRGIHLLWKWPKSAEKYSEGIKIAPQLWRPKNGLLMTNVLGANPDISKPCFALTKNDSYLISASGGEFSLFNMHTFKRLTTFMPPPPATAIALYPKDNNVCAIGREDSTIVIYNIRINVLKWKLEGHSKWITDLAFSTTVNKLISVGADAKIVSWDSDRWEKQEITCLPSPNGARIQFHPDQVHFLSIQDTALAIYEAEELRCLQQWFIRKYSSPISHATFSCDGTMIYACCHDASVSIFDASNLQSIVCITPAVYLPAEYIRPSMSVSHIRPLAITSHPHITDQFALGLENGNVIIFEPPKPQGKWVVPTTGA